jgi:hypothetical protein
MTRLTQPSQVGRTAVRIASMPVAARSDASAIPAPMKKAYSTTPSACAAEGSNPSAADGTHLCGRAR